MNLIAVSTFSLIISYGIYIVIWLDCNSSFHTLSQEIQGLSLLDQLGLQALTCSFIAPSHLSLTPVHCQFTQIPRESSGQGTIVILDQST